MTTTPQPRADGGVPRPDVTNEDGSTTNSQNAKLVIRAIGYGLNNTKVTLEAILSTTTLPAIVADGDIDIGGSVAIRAATAAPRKRRHHASGELAQHRPGPDGHWHDRTRRRRQRGRGYDRGESYVDVPALLPAKWLDLKTHVDYFLGTDGLIGPSEGGAVMCAGRRSGCESPSDGIGTAAATGAQHHASCGDLLFLRIDHALAAAPGR